MVMKEVVEYKKSVYLIIILFLTGFIISESLHSSEDPLLSVEVARKEYLKGHYDKAMELLMETDVKTSDKNIKALIYVEMAYVKYLMGYRGFSCRFYIKKAINYNSEPEGIGLYEKGFLKILKDVHSHYTPGTGRNEDKGTTNIPSPVKKIPVTAPTKSPVSTEEEPAPARNEKDFDVRIFEKHYDGKLREIHNLNSKIASLNSRIKLLRNRNSKNIKDTSAMKKERNDLKQRSLKAEERVTELMQQIDQMKRDQEVLVERIVATKLKKMQDELKAARDSETKKAATARDSNLNSLEILHKMWKKEKPPLQQKNNAGGNSIKK